MLIMDLQKQKYIKIVILLTLYDQNNLINYKHLMNKFKFIQNK